MPVTSVNLQSMVDDHRRDKNYTFIGLMLLNSLTDEIAKQKDFDPTAIQVSMQINGKDIDPLNFFTRLEKSWGDDVEDHAKKMVKRSLDENIGKLMNRLSLINDEIGDHIKMVPDLEWILRHD